MDRLPADFCNPGRFRVYDDFHRSSPTQRLRLTIDSVKSVKKNDASITDTFIKLMKIVEETIVETIDLSEEELNNFKEACLKNARRLLSE